MSTAVERLATEAAHLEPAEFAKFLRRLAEARGLALNGKTADLDTQLRRDEQALAELSLGQDWQDMADDWEDRP